jgi:hypothetical protein
MSDEERMPSLRSLQIPSIGHTMPTAKQKDRNKSEESFRSLTLAIKPGVGREQQASLDFCLAPLFEIGKQVRTSGVGLRTFPNCVHLHTLLAYTTPQSFCHSFRWDSKYLTLLLQCANPFGCWSAPSLDPSFARQPRLRNASTTLHLKPQLFHPRPQFTIHSLPLSDVEIPSRESKTTQTHTIQRSCGRCALTRSSHICG